MMPVLQAQPADGAIACLTRLLTNELAAVASYHQACHGFATAWDTDWGICQTAHQTQADLLTARLHVLGGYAPTGADPWPAVVAALATVDAGDGLRLVHGALRSGEDRGLADYLGRQPDLDGTSARMVQEQILPSQFTAHEAMRRICGQRVLSLMAGGV